jgi:hypothetical protein
MAEDGIPEILAEQRLGHEVPGMRGLYAHASERMRDELKAALQARWEDSLRERAAIHPHSPVPLLGELMAPFRTETRVSGDPLTPRERAREPATPGDREKMISQIPPKCEADLTPATRVRSPQRASDLVKHQNQGVELRGFDSLTPSMRTKRSRVHSDAARVACGRSSTKGAMGSALAERRAGASHQRRAAMLWQPNCQRLWWPSSCSVADRVLPPLGQVSAQREDHDDLLNSYKQTAD